MTTGAPPNPRTFWRDIWVGTLSNLFAAAVIAIIASIPGWVFREQLGPADFLLRYVGGVGVIILGLVVALYAGNNITPVQGRGLRAFRWIMVVLAALGAVALGAFITMSAGGDIATYTG